MTPIGHNGGPRIEAHDVPDMNYVKFYFADFLNGTAHLSLEMVGAYIRALCVMWDRMGGMPYDEIVGGPLLRVDKRVYRRVRDQLLAEGKFFRDGDMIRNVRVEREISDYVTEYRRRSEAAKRREAERKLHRTSGELPPDFARTSGELPAKVQDKSSKLGAKKPIKTTSDKPQGGRILESRSYKLEANNKKEREEGTALPTVADATPPPSDGYQPADALRCFEAYNALAQRVGLPLARGLTPERRKMICCRLRDHGGYPAWELILANIERSAFLRGNNDRNWRPTGLDWFLKPANFTKVIEGAYGNGAHGDTLEKPETQSERTARLLREMSESGQI